MSTDKLELDEFIEYIPEDESDDDSDSVVVCITKRARVTVEREDGKRICYDVPVPVTGSESVSTCKNTLQDELAINKRMTITNVEFIETPVIKKVKKKRKKKSQKERNKRKNKKNSTKKQTQPALEIDKPPLTDAQKAKKERRAEKLRVKNKEHRKRKMKVDQKQN